MADEKIVTSIVANSDFSNLIADVQRVTASLSRLQQEFAGSNRSLAGQIDATNAMFSETMRKTGQFSTHFVSLTSDVEKFGRNLDSGRLKLRDYFRVYQDHTRTTGGLIRDLAKQQVQLQNAVLQPLGRNAQGLMQYNVHIPRGLDLTKNKTSILKQELQIMNKVIQDGGVQLINWGKNTQWAGRQLTVGLTLPLVAFGKAAADAFKVADQELTRLTKVYGDIAGTSAQELGQIRKEVSATAKELSAAMGVNFTETISLAADIAATGKTGNELLSSVSETTRLAVLGEVDRQEAMKATLAIQSAFKQNTEELAETINFLNAVENQTSTTLNDLVTAIPKAGPVIKGLGGSVQDLALYLTAMREGGINATEGANALKSALASLINPTDVAVKKFQGFGIDLLGIVQKNAGSTTDTLFALQAALDNLNPLQKQQAIEQLFGKFQYSRLNALFENLGKQGSQTLQVLDLMKASAGELEAVAGRELAAVTESAAGRYKRAVETLKAELAGVGDQFLNIGTKLVNVLSKIIEFAQKLPDPIKKIMAFGGAFTAIIGPIIMLTGVLANFFGYIIKGLGHFKALFKGAEGFKLLTPEIMAAKAAGSQLANEFYSDALAADTLRIAIEKLNNDLVLLQKNALGISKPGSTTGQLISTIAGTPLMAVGGGARVTDPNHPLVGTQSRAAAHLNPRDPNNPSSIFGLTLQPIPLNRKIGRTPQVMMTEALPNIEGVTSHQGYSTGVVAGEHARYAALMATLGIQSRQEIEALKKTIALGGQVSTEFISTFDDILPITQRLTQNAATQSASIVAQLRAGQLSAEQARAAIIAVNADLERMMGSEISLYAASRGRTIDLSKAPLINQPVVDASGKPNTRGMFRQGIFSDVMSAVGRATGTRTFGGPYSIETTTPSGLIIQRKNAGGKIKGYIGGGGIYETDGMTVPGPNVNADVVPAMLTPGEFVLTRGTVEREGSDSVEALHRGEATIVPITFNANSGGKVPGVQYRRFGSGILRVGGSASRTRDIFGKGGFGGSSWLTRNPRTASTIESYISQISNPEDKIRAAALIQQFAAGITTGAGSPLGRARYPGVIQPGHITREEVGLSAFLQKNGLPAMQIGLPTHSTHLTRSSVVGSQRYVSRYEVDYDAMSNLEANQGTLLVKNFLARNMSRSRKYDSLFRQVGVPESKWNFVEKEIDRRIQANLAAKGEMRIGDNFGDLTFQDSLIPIIDDVMVNNGADPLAITMIKRNTTKRRIGNNIFGPEIMKMFGFNRGGMVPGYMGGGKISRATLLARLGAKFKFTGKHYSGPQALETYSINAMDMNGGRKYFGDLPISDKARGALYNSTVDFFNSNVIRPDRGAPEQRGFGVRHLATAFPTIASMALNAGKDFLTKDDITLLSSYAGKSGSLRGSMGASLALHRVAKVFRANRGGSVPGYMGGGSVPRYGYARGVQNRFAGGGILKMLAAMGIMQAGMGAGQRMGGAGGQALSTASSFLPFMFMGMGPGMGGGEGPSVQQRLGMSSIMTPNLGAFGRPLTAGSPLVTQTLIPQIAGRKQSIFAQGTPMLGKFAGNVERATTSSSGFVRALGKIGLGLTRTNVALGLAAGAVTLAYKAWKNYQEGLERARLSAGLNEEQAGKLGLKYRNVASEIKTLVEASKAWLDSNRAIYEGMQSADAPFKMTVAEYRKLRKEVKGTMKDQIDLINNTKKQDLSAVATQMKAMFVAAGMSAQEASRKIYMAFTLSNKAASAYTSTIGSQTFSRIVNTKTAAEASIKYLNELISRGGDGEAQLNAFNTAMQAILRTIEETTAKQSDKAQKEGKDFDERSAALQNEKQLLDDLSKTDLRPIGKGLYDELVAVDPVLATVISKADNLRTIMQKMTLLKFGIDPSILMAFSSRNEADLQEIYNQSIKISQDVEKASRKNLASRYEEIDALEKLIKKRETAAKGESAKTQINRRDRIKALQEEIDKINEAADARRKALQEEAEDQDVNIEIQKKRLEYQQKLAAGDMAGAAQAQLDLTKLTGKQQRTITERQIEEKRARDIEPLQSEIDKLNQKTQDMADAAALAGDSLDKLRVKLDDAQKKLDEYNQGIVKYILDKAFNGGENLDILSEAAIAAAKALGLAPKKIKELLGIETPTKTVDTTTLAGVEAASRGGNKRLNPLGIDLERYAAPEGYQRKIPDPYKKTAGGKSPIEVALGFGTPNSKAGDLSYTVGFNPSSGKWQAVKKPMPSNWVSPEEWVLGQRTFAMGGYIRGFSDGTTHGPVEGPGTWTSDSILARLSDGEFVTRSVSVHDAGVDNMHLINEKGAAGIVEAAMNLIMKKDGGSIDKFDRGGPVSPYNKKGKPTGSPYGPRWGELVRDIHGLAYGRDIWGGTEIPGLKFRGKIPNHSDYWHQMQEQPPKPIRGGGGLGIAKDPIGLSGSVPFEGLFGGGIGFGGMLTMKDGGYIPRFAKGGISGRKRTSIEDFINKILEYYANRPDLPYSRPGLLPMLPGGVGPFGVQMYHSGGPVKSLDQVPFTFGKSLKSENNGKKKGSFSGQSKLDIAQLDESGKPVQDFNPYGYINLGDEYSLGGDNQKRIPKSNPARQVQDYVHALISLANTYYGAKYQKLFRSLGVKNTKTTNLDVIGLQNSIDVNANPGVAFINSIGGDKTRDIMLNPYSILADAKEFLPGGPSTPAQNPNPDGSINLSSGNYFFAPGKISTLDPKKYETWLSKNAFNTPRGKMNLIMVAFHEFAHSIMSKIQASIRDKLKALPQEVVPIWDGKGGRYTELSDSAGLDYNHEYMADDFAGAMFSELSSKGFITGISKDYIDYLKRFAEKNKNTQPGGFSPAGHPLNWDFRGKTFAENLLPGDTDTTTSIIARMLDLSGINNLAGKKLVPANLKENPKYATQLINNILSGKVKGSSPYMRIKDVAWEGQDLSYAEYTDEFGKQAGTALGSKVPSSNFFAKIWNAIGQRLQDNSPYSENNKISKRIKMAGGGYINPSYSANMSMPSYKTGVKYLYDDTIAQLHKGEAVLPENMNPWNPNSNSPIGGNTYYLQPVIHAAEGMDLELIGEIVTRKTLNAMKSLESVNVQKVGPKRVI